MAEHLDTVDETREFEERWDTLAFGDTVPELPEATILPAQSDRLPSFADDVPSINASVGGQLEMGRTLGEGGMGVVRLATQAALGRQVAVKSLKPKLRSPRTIRKLLGEAMIMGRLDHPNVVPVHALGMDEDMTPLIVMKRVEGVSWLDLLRSPETVQERFGVQDPLDWHVEVLIQLCNVVEFAHSRGVIHRDIKPENVMIGGFGEVYLVDWGIAVATEASEDERLPKATLGRGPAGTPCYMAPEMVDNDSEVDQRTDVFLLGAVLHEMLTGYPPHRGKTAQIAMMSAFICRPPELDDGLPSELTDLCSAALSKDPSGRPAGAGPVRAALVSYQQHTASRQLAEEANTRLTRLLELALTPDPTDRRQRAVGNLYTECLFAFRQALRTWPANPQAVLGVRQATVTMSRYELDRGNVTGARRALANLDEPPADLVAEIDQLAAELEADEAQRARLVRMGTALDWRIGQRTRAAVSGVLGIVWAFSAPAMGLAWAEGWIEISAPYLIAYDLFLLAFGYAIFLWARETLTASVFNLRVVVATLLLFVAQVVLAIGGFLAGSPSSDLMNDHVFLWATFAGILSVTLDRAFIPIALVYLAGYFVVSASHEWWVPVATIGNLFCGLWLFFSWRPASWRLGGKPRPSK